MRRTHAGLGENALLGLALSLGVVAAGEAKARSDGGGVEVFVGIFVIDVTEIDDAAQSFRADVHLSARWRDGSLAAPGSGPRRIGLSDVWHPHLGVRNRRDVQPLLPMEVEVDEDGNVQYRQRISGELSARLDLRDFPFDSQALAIQIVSLRYGSDEVSLHVDPERSGRLDGFTVAGWDVTLGEPRAVAVDVAALGRAYSQIDLPLVARRQVSYYRWTMLAPLVLIVLMAWSVFWVDPSLLPSQLSVSTASVFALIAFRLSMRDLLPRVSYTTRGDVFLLGCTLLVFAAFGQTIVTGSLAKSGRTALALSVDRWSRWIYLTTFAFVWWVTVSQP